MDGMNSDARQALVLVAGEGSRLRKYAKQETIHPVAGVPLLEGILQGLKEAGVDGVRIVIGYEGDDIRREIGKDYSGLDVGYVMAQNWEKGNLHSFLAVEARAQLMHATCMPTLPLLREWEGIEIGCYV